MSILKHEKHNDCEINAKLKIHAKCYQQSISFQGAVKHSLIAKVNGTFTHTGSVQGSITFGTTKSVITRTCVEVYSVKTFPIYARIRCALVKLSRTVVTNKAGTADTCVRQYSVYAFMHVTTRIRAAFVYCGFAVCSCDSRIADARVAAGVVTTASKYAWIRATLVHVSAAIEASEAQLTGARVRVDGVQAVAINARR